MRVTVVFHHDPINRKPGIDTVRLAYITSGTKEMGIEVKTGVGGPLHRYSQSIGYR